MSMKLPEFIIKVKILSTDYNGNFRPVDELIEPFNKYTKSLSSKIKKDQEAEFSQLLHYIWILIKNYEVLDQKIGELELEYNKLKKKLNKSIEQAEYEKALNAWIGRNMTTNDINVSSNQFIKSRKDALGDEIDYFKDLMNFSYNAKKYLIEESTY